jgi:Fe(3+) dicitrate transport protein
VKKLAIHNNKTSRWAPLVLALAVSATLPAAYAADAIHIQAQPLGAALSQLGQQTSLQVFFSPDLVAGKQAPAVDGNLSPEQALRQLLQGSGLDYQIDAGSVTLRPLNSGTGEAGSPLELGATDIKVVGDWLGDANAEVVQNHAGARTVIRRETMVEQGAMNVGDVLRRVPGVQVQESNGTGGSDISLNVGVRGLTSRLSPRSTVLIDGVPAAFAPYGQPQLSMAPISAGNLDSIDVVRGAGSVRYGPQNVGGVINFVTRAIPEKFSGEVGTTLQTSAHGGWKHVENAFIGGTADNGLGGAILYSGTRGGDWRENSNTRIDDLILKGKYQLDDANSFNAMAQYYEGQADMPGGLNVADYKADPYQSTRPYDKFWKRGQKAINRCPCCTKPIPWNRRSTVRPPSWNMRWNICLVNCKASHALPGKTSRPPKSMKTSLSRSFSKKNALCSTADRFITLH